MARPRPIFKSRTYLVTRRCTQRQFLLRPEKAITEGFKYALGYAAKCHGILIYAAIVMSNHYHLVVRDRNGSLPHFVQQLNSATGHTFNVLRCRRENFWSTRRSRSTYLVAIEDILRKVVYTLVNPVEAGLVDRAVNWPGLTSFHWLDGRTVTAARPNYYFDEDGDMPERVSFTLAVPPEFDGDLAAWSALIERRVEAEEARLAEERRNKKVGIRGRKAVLADSFKRCGTEEEELGDLQPLVAAADSRRMKEALRELKSFYRRYRRALEKLRAGAWDTVFPAGTFLLVDRYNVRVAPP